MGWDAWGFGAVMAVSTSRGGPWTSGAGVAISGLCWVVAGSEAGGTISTSSLEVEEDPVSSPPVGFVLSITSTSLFSLSLLLSSPRSSSESASYVRAEGAATALGVAWLGGGTTLIIWREALRETRGLALVLSEWALAMCTLSVVTFVQSLPHWSHVG